MIRLNNSVDHSNQQRYFQDMNGLDHNLVEIDPEKLGGTPVFRGTRVPIQNLFDCLETGETIEQFLKQYPTVNREQVTGVLEESMEQLLVGYELVA